jgi:hypothetical protein
VTTHRWAGQPAELARVYVMLAFDEGSSSPARGWRSPAAARVASSRVVYESGLISGTGVS